MGRGAAFDDVWPAQRSAVAAFNKNLDRAVGLLIDAGRRAEHVSSLRLLAPRVDDTTDTTFGGAPVGVGGVWCVARKEALSTENGTSVIELAPASGALVTLE